jgi:hypothetical protein
MAALDPAALDLEADDPLVGMAEDEIALVGLGAGDIVAVHDARRVIGLPLLGQAVAHGLEHPPLGPALELLLE